MAAFDDLRAVVAALPARRGQVMERTLRTCEER